MTLAITSSALDEALDIMGQSSKGAMQFYLKERYGIFAENRYRLASPISIERLQSAMVGILGTSGAAVIMENVFIVLDKLSGD